MRLRRDYRLHFADHMTIIPPVIREGRAGSHCPGRITVERTAQYTQGIPEREPERRYETMTKTRQSNKQLLKRLALYAVLTGIMIVLGVVNIPMPTGLNITFNMIPVAIAAIAVGLEGGAVMGAVFGLISYFQCFHVCGFSALGEACALAAPFLTFLQRFFSRFIMGLSVGLVSHLLKRKAHDQVRFAVVGFLAAFLNTLFFMGLLVLLLGDVADVQQAVAGRSFFVYVVASVGINGLVEMAVSTVLTGAICTALKKARLLNMAA